MNAPDQKHIAAQALKALQLRRQLERGEVTHEEYLTRLDAPQSCSVAPAIPQSPPVNSPSTQADSPPLMSALEVLQLRRRLDNGELTRQEYQARLYRGLEPEHVTTAGGRGAR